MSPGGADGGRRRALAAVGGLAAITIAGATGCAALFVPRTLRIDEADLAARLAARFPLDRELLGRYALTLADPQLRLLPDDDRLAVELTLRVGDLRRPRQVDARVAFDFGLAVDAGESALRLVQPRLRRAELLRDGGDAVPLGDGALRAAMPLAEAWLDGLVVYRLPQRRVDQLRAAGLRLGELKVVSRAVELTLQPIDAPGAGAALP